MQDHKMLTQASLAARWGVDRRTICVWVGNGKLKPNKITNMFSLDYVEAIEREGIDLDTVGVFRLRSLERENQRLREENAMLKSTLLQVAMIATEGTRKILEKI